MAATRNIIASKEILAATPLSLAELDAMLSVSEGPRRIIEVRRRVDSYENLADFSQSARRPQNLLSALPYVLVQEAAPPHNARIVRSERVARLHVRASHAATDAQTHAKALSRNCGSFSERNCGCSGLRHSTFVLGTCLSATCAPALVSQDT